MKFLFSFITALVISESSFSQWNSNPAINTSVCVQANDQQDVRIVTDSKGGAIITWLDYRNDITQLSGDIFVQRMGKNGINKWTVQGVVLCTDVSNQTAPAIVEDGSSGAIIAWNDWRNGTRDIYAQKIDSLGVVQWTANGIAVAAKANSQQDAKLISDGAGGAIVVWQDSANGIWDVYVQRISSTGALLWAAAGISISSSPDAQINPRIETDGAGGAVIVWQDKRNVLDYDIYAQRVNASGVVQWAANGVAICVTSGTQSNPKIEPDGYGGTFIAWQDKRNGLDYNVYAQRLNAAGQVQWAANGVAVCTAPSAQSAVDIASDNISGVIIGVIIVWKDLRSGNYDVYAQKLNIAGAVQWTANGIGIVTTSGAQLNPNIIGDDIGGAIIAWQDSSLGASDIKSQRVNGSGVVQWTAGGVAVGTAADDQTSPKNVSDGAGGSIFAWQDKRNTSDFDIYAHHLYANGTVDGIQEHDFLMESKCFPNPFSSSAIIQVIGPFGKETLRNIEFGLLDILGKNVEVAFSVSGNAIHVLRDNVASGTYLYEVRENSVLIARGKLMLTGKY